MTLIDFTLSNARRFYSSMGNPSDTEGLSVLKDRKVAQSAPSQNTVTRSSSQLLKEILTRKWHSIQQQTLLKKN